MMKRRKIMTVTLCLLLLLVTGCSQTADVPKIQSTPCYSFLIGVSHANLVEPWRISLHEDLQQFAKEYDDVRLIFTDAAFDSNRQKEDLQHLVDLGIDLLIVSPNDEEISRTISEIHQKIPVIVLDRNIDNEDYTIFIGPNNQKIGELAGLAVIETLGKAGGNVLEITGNASSPPAQEISKGFSDAIAIHENIHITSQIDAQWLRDIAEMRMKDFLIGNQPVDIVFAHNDAMAFGAFTAAEQFRVMGISFVSVYDSRQEEKNSPKKDEFSIPFFRQSGGKEAIQYAYKILQNEPDIPKKIILDPQPLP